MGGAGSMKTVKEITEEFETLPCRERGELYRIYQDDPRSGVQKLLERYRKKDEALEKEKLRMDEMLQYEREYSHLGYLCGIDKDGRCPNAGPVEAGGGPLAGPVVAGAVILPQDKKILYLNDSKKLSPAKREELYDVIMDEAVAVGVGIVGPASIDEINILQATYEAMRQALGKLS